MAQYQDFSEDLDPVLAVPHPVMTFRKLEKTLEISPHDSSVNWGVVSPDVMPVNVNQNVIREFTWGNRGGGFEGMLSMILPASFSARKTALVYEAWQCVDEALKSWPQFWGLRLQDSGMRLRWLVKPFDLEKRNTSFGFWIDRQIYRDTTPHPLSAFMDLSPGQAVEVSDAYAGMAEKISRAGKLLREAESDWLNEQVNSLRTLELFWKTYCNLFGFWGHRLLGETERCRGFVRAEMQNLQKTIDHLSAHPETIVIARKGAWGQCFGLDYLEEFRKKRTAMMEYSFDGEAV